MKIVVESHDLVTTAFFWRITSVKRNNLDVTENKSMAKNLRLAREIKHWDFFLWKVLNQFSIGEKCQIHSRGKWHLLFIYERLACASDSISALRLLLCFDIQLNWPLAKAVEKSLCLSSFLSSALASSLTTLHFWKWLWSCGSIHQELLWDKWLFAFKSRSSCQTV